MYSVLKLFFYPHCETVCRIELSLLCINKAWIYLITSGKHESYPDNYIHCHPVSFIKLCFNKRHKVEIELSLMDHRPDE